MSKRVSVLAGAVGVSVVASLLAAVSPASAQAPRPSSASPGATRFGFQGSGFGTQVAVGSTVKSGPSALVNLGCTFTPGITRTNTAAQVNAAPALSSGAIATRVASRATATGIASAGSAATEQLSALGGMITATAVKAVSTTSHRSSSGAFSVSSAGTTFTGLVVAGRPIGGTPAPNTTLALPGIGKVVLNEQSAHVASSSASLRVLGIHIYVTSSSVPGNPAGTQILVSSAFSALNGPVFGPLAGLAYGTSANVGTTVTAGRSFPAYLGCNGTNGVTRTNSGLSVSIPGVLSTGTVTDTAQGVSNRKTISGHMTATVQALNLLARKVTATAIKADVTATGKPTALADHSSFLGLKVAGFPAIKDSVPVNTHLTLVPGITLWLHRRVQTRHSISVVMVQLVVTGPNQFGRALGTTVNVAYAGVAVN